MAKIEKMSELFVRTLREDPADAEIKSHKLLIRAGYIRQVAPGIFSWLPLGLKVLAKIEAIINEEMRAIGCQEVHFPALLPREPYEKTNRWTEYGPNIFRLKDRKDADYLLAPTHEEMFALIVKDLFNSYKDLPVMLYQIQTKYRDEARPRAGLLRGREFIMKDAYSFDLKDEGLAESYEKQRGAYQRIFDRLGLPYKIVKAMSGPMGGSRSEEFLSPTPVGEDTFVVAPSGYAANVEAADILAPKDLSEEEIAKLPAYEVIETPNAKSIEEVSAVVGSKPENMLKTVYLTLNHPVKEGELPEKEVVIVCIPGDRDVDMKRVEAIFSPAEVEQADADVLKGYPELVPGFVGPFTGRAGEPETPLGKDGKPVQAIRFFYDELINRGSVWVAGANEKDKHIKNLVAGRDFVIEDSQRIGAVEVREGDQAADGSGKLEIQRGVEIGHIFALGRKYTEAFDVKVLDENGKSQVLTMGSYGIGVTRALALLAENYSDDKGLAWPDNIAPANVYIVVASKDQEVLDCASEFAEKCIYNDLDVILDDRKVSPGVKFKDSELLGIPKIVVFGRGLKNETPTVEVKIRATGESQDAPVDEALGLL
ncbi:MAG: proline--tRNA ligase [Candidatus Ancillula sp.]|jgi:prolyl-tRNA synthetase|nr:proline--tRNA ligase [Candidatus Ancillula sp.]